MSYVGQIPLPQATEARTSHTVTAAESPKTSFNVQYVPLYLDVFINGVLQDPATDYTATNGTSVNLTTGAVTGDIVSFIARTQTSALVALPLKDSQGNNVLSESSGTVTINNSTIGSNVNFGSIANDSISGDKIHGGTISGVTLDSNTNFGSIANDSISGNKIHGGTISNTTIDNTNTVSINSLNASDILAAVETADKPSDFWSSTYIPVSGLGYLGTQGSYNVSLVSNGYRNSSGQWASLGVNSKAGAASVELNPAGYIYLNAAYTQPTTQSYISTRLLLSQDRLEYNGREIADSGSVSGKGWYVRYYDGTQICFFEGGTNSYTWTFPAAFSTASGIVLVGNARDYTTNPRTVMFGTASSTSVNVQCWTTWNYPASFTLSAVNTQVLAIGRW